MTSISLVSIVIPARNEQAFIKEAVTSALNQSYPNIEVLVVDGDSEDATASIVQAMAAADSRVRLVRNPDRIIPVALNRAFRAARGKWFVRLDAHAAIGPNFVEIAVSHLETGQYGGVGGRKNGVPSTIAGQAVAAAMASRFGVGDSVYHYGTTVQEVDHIPFGAYPMSVIEQVGGWNEDLRVNQDYEFDYRIRMSGLTLLFDPELVIQWESRQSIGELFSQYRRYGRGKARVVGLHPRSVKARHLAAPALVAALGAACALVPVRPRWAMAIAAPYAAGVVVASGLAAKDVQNKRAIAYLPAAFLAMHIGWGSGFLGNVGELVRGLGEAVRETDQSRSVDDVLSETVVS